VQVSSTSSVNTVVETLIGDWDFFFEGEVNFYETMSRDQLFPDNGGFSYDREPMPKLQPKAQNPLMSVSMIVGDSEKNGPGEARPKMTHSRSSSLDASQILLNDPSMKSSRSNSSLSDVSPTTGSPKQPRRKPKAPVPPMLTPQPAKPKLEAKVSLPSSVSKLYDTANFSYIDSDPSLHVDEARNGNLRKAGSTDNIIQRPDRPPRPALANAECQTLSRAVVRQVPLKDKSSVPARPVAAPRSTLMRNEFEKSEENLVTMREKPAIPDRPTTLMRPASFRAATGGMTSPTKIVEELSAAFANKAGAHPSNVRRNNSMREGRTSESEDMPQSKHVTMYNVDKQQVSIVDLPPSGSPHPSRRQLFISESDNKENSQNLNVKSELSGSSDALADDASSQMTPPSPRDAKIKRPQVPPPARPRSSEGSGDSTNL
jgi:hypothetical protein